MIDRLGRAYGIVPPVVLVYGRPLLVGRAQRPEARRVDDLHAAIPGKQPLEKWLRRRLAMLPYEVALADARVLADRHAAAFRALTNGTVWERLTLATVHALREHDPHLADLERLYLNGATHAELGALMGVDAGRARKRLDQLRALGFDVPYRRGYAPRGGRAERFEVPLGRDGCRLVG